MRGRLEVFNLGEVLQLYQIAGRTGMVRVWQEMESERVLYVDRGRISGVDADGWRLIDEVRKIE
jgi:hypothetical protein